MFGNIRIKPAKSTTKRLPSSSRFSFIRVLTDKCYRDPYNWGLIKCIGFFAASICVGRVLCELDILPVDAPEQPIGWHIVQNLINYWERCRD